MKKFQGTEILITTTPTRTKFVAIGDQKRRARRFVTKELSGRCTLDLRGPAATPFQEMMSHTPLLTGVKRVTMMKMLGVTVTNTLSVAEHVQAILRACAPSIHALRILCCHGLNDTALQIAY